MDGHDSSDIHPYEMLTDLSEHINELSNVQFKVLYFLCSKIGSESEVELRIKEIAAPLLMSKETIHRALNVLESQNFININRDGLINRYSHGSKIS